MTPNQHLTTFYTAWASAMATVRLVGVEAPPHLGEAIRLEVGGYGFPLITGLFAIAAVIAGSVLGKGVAGAGSAPIGVGKRVLVAVVMTMIALIWIDMDRPALLYAFVISLGLGYSGIALIALAGEEITAFVKRIFAGVTGALGNFGKPASAPSAAPAPTAADAATDKKEA